jgi:hypothetical protein
MLRKVLTGTAIACVLTFGLPSGTAAQGTDAKDDAKKAGREAKEAGKHAGEAAKDAAKATGKATKKAAKTVKKKVTPSDTTATCKDGTVQKGKTKTTACADHGGVQS